jgi:ribonuclease G
MKQVEETSPALRDRVELYEQEMPIFECLGVERDVEHMTSRYVRLPRGGSLVIDQTEALVVIDVNTGSYVGGMDQEDTVFQTNLDAADEIVRQLRLRDLGGIIVADFIDMEEQAHRDALVARLRTALARDRARSSVLPVSELGIVEMTRERVRSGVAQMMVETCPVCRGVGKVVALSSAALSLDRRLAGIRAAQDEDRVRIEVCPELDAHLASVWGSRWDQIRAEIEVLRVDGESGFRREGFRVSRRLDN